MPITDQQRCTIARTLDEKCSYSLALLGWMECMFSERPVSASQNVLEAFVDYINWSFTHELVGLTSICVQVFLRMGLQWDMQLQERTALSWVICNGTWTDVHTVVDIMLQSEVNWIEQHACFPLLCKFVVNGLPVWKKIAHRFDPPMLTAAWGFLWRNHPSLVLEWAPVWFDLCRQTYGVAANLLAPIHVNYTIIDFIGNWPDDSVEDVMNVLELIYEKRCERRPHLINTLKTAFRKEQHNEIYQAVTEFDLGTQNAYDDPLVWKRKIRCPRSLPPLWSSNIWSQHYCSWFPVVPHSYT